MRKHIITIKENKQLEDIFKEFDKEMEPVQNKAKVISEQLLFLKKQSQNLEEKARIANEKAWRAAEKILINLDLIKTNPVPTLEYSKEDGSIYETDIQKQLKEFLERITKND